MSRKNTVEKPQEDGADARPGSEPSSVDALALSAISALKTDRRPGGTEGVALATGIVRDAVLLRDGYDAQAVIEELRGRGFEASDIIDVFIPNAARALGQAWLDDELSFTRVSAATSRLFGLSKSLAVEWDKLLAPEDSLGILVASFRREDHLLGPGILAQQIRRRMHSVQVMSNTDAAAIEAEIARGDFDGLMVSAASLVSLETAVIQLDLLRRSEQFNIPVIVGGRALDYSDRASQDIPADLVTDDVDIALAAIEDFKSQGKRRMQR